MVYPLVCRMVTIILTLQVSIATTERSFEAMKIVKTRLRSMMEEDFLSDCLQIYVKKEIGEKFNVDSLIDDFRDFKERQCAF